MSQSPFPCSKYPERHFSTLLEAVEYVLSKRGTSKRVQCFVGDCRKTVRDRKLRLHIRKSHKDVCPWLCSDCPAKFVGWNDWNNHQRNGCPRSKVACVESVSLGLKSQDTIGMHKAM